MRKYLNGTNVPCAGAITQEQLKELLEYDQVSGTFYWKKRSSDRIQIGQKAGRSQNGYCVIGILGRVYRAHRLAFLYMTGSFPEKYVDHIDGVRSNNAWANLRNVCVQENQRNAARSKNNTSGTVGVVWDKVKMKWMARISVDYKDIFLGYFDDISDAVRVRKEAEQSHKFHPNHGRITHA